MRLFSRYNLLIFLSIAPLALQVTFWIRSYFGNDYIFCRWLTVTDENGNNADVMSRTPGDWNDSLGSKFQSRYAAIVSRGGGVCIGLVLGRYVATAQFDLSVMLVVEREQLYRKKNDPRGSFIGFRHSSATEYPLTEEEPRYGFGYQNHVYTWRGSANAYREHWAIVFPHWFLFLLLLLPTDRLLIRYLRKSRWQARGCCLKCGYDLRATPGQCPECGNKTAKPA